MAYIGKGLEDTPTANITVDKMTGDNAPNGVRTTLACSLSQAPASVNDINVFVDGIKQRPGTDYTLSNWTISFTTAPQTGQNVVAICKGATWQDYVADSTVTSDKIQDSAVTNAKLTGSIDASKLIGTFPAISGSALTGIVSEATISNSDPLITTNETTLGKVYINSSSGEVFVLTDATTNANVWINIGSGDGDFGKSFGGRGGGTVAGFSTGGYSHTPAGGNVYPLSIEKFLFASGGALTDHGDITHQAREAAGFSSATHGYVAGGNGTGNAKVATIEKYAFASANTVSNHGNCATPLLGNVGSCSSKTDGYQCGGSFTGQIIGGSSRVHKMPFASNTTMVAHSNLTLARYVNGGGVSSTTHGYNAGGNQHPSAAIGAPIDRFSFSSNASASDHGDLAGNAIRYGGAGISSDTHGYYAGAHSGAAYLTGIDKYSYASNVTATVHANLSTGVHGNSGCSGTTEGFSVSGATSTGYPTLIEKFSYASQNTVANHSNLSAGRQSGPTAQF